MLSYFLEYNRYLNVVGIGVIMGLAALFSYNRRAINMRLAILALMIQISLAAVMMFSSVGRDFVGALSNGIGALYQSAQAGIQFLFGPLALATGPWGFVFAIQVLPITIFFSAFTAILIHLGIIQRIAALLSYALEPLLGVTAAESLCAVSNSFLGQTEAPLLIRHALASLTESEMLVVMVSGMGTISGPLLAVYSGMGVPIEHLLASSIMAIPGTILIAKILCPEMRISKGAEQAEVESVPARNVISALCVGTIEGLQLALNIGAILIAFIALLALINGIFSSVCMLLTLPVITLQTIFGWIFAPFGFLLGFEGREIFIAGELIGTKVVANEMIAYTDMVSMGLSERALSIMTYALCGFGNFASIGLQVAVIGALAPTKREMLSKLGLYAVLGGTLSNLLSACIAGLFL